nr:retrovirus-related Pol polyprotein from transposon TNT 1-94 [Tanacetum cinerariifolium]
MTFEEMEAKFNSIWKQMEDFIPMGSNEEAERIKRKEDVTEEAQPPEEVPEEKVKEMMQLVPIEKVEGKGDDAAGSHRRSETLNNRPPTSDKEMELWVELNRMYEPDNSRLYDSFDENNLFIFDDESDITYLALDNFVSRVLKSPLECLHVFLQTEDGVDLLTGDRSSNLYTITLNEVVSNSSAYLLAKASSLQSWLWHQRLSHFNFTTINNLVKNNLVQGLPKMKFEKDHLCSACEQGKIHRKHHKSKTAFASDKPLYLIHMNLCGPMRVESINGKRYVLIVVDDYSQYTWVFFLHSKDEASEVIISFIKKTQVNIQLQVRRVQTDNGTDFKKLLLCSLMRRSWESSSSSLNDDVQQSLEEVEVSSSNTQSVSNNMVPNVDKASASHNVFNEPLKDAYFNASTLFHHPSNVYTFYQPYPHEKKWTKDHPLHKIIGDLKSSVRTRGQLANSC